MTAPPEVRRHHRLLAVAVLTAFVLLALQSGAIMTVLALALDDLGASTDVGSTMAFFLAANLVGMSGGGLLCRWLSPGRVVLLCMLVGAVGLGIGAAAPGLGVFLTGRALQGVGNGACMVALYVIAAAGFEGRARARLLRGITTAWMLPTIVGPAIAGAIAEHLGWRTVFGGGAAGLVGAGILVGAASGRLEGVRSQVLPRVVAAAGAAALGVCGLQALPTDSMTLSVVAGVLFAVLVVTGAHVMLPARTLTLSRGAPSGIALRGLLAGAFFGVEAWVPLLLIEQGRMSADRAGFLIGLGGVCWVAGAWLHGRRRTDDGSAERGRGLLSACAVIVVGMLALTVAAAVSAAPAVIGVSWALACFGMGAALPVVSILVFDQTSARDYAEASVGLQSSDALGCAAVVALCGLLFAVVHPHAASAAYAVVFGLGGIVAVAGVVAAPRLLPQPAVMSAR